MGARGEQASGGIAQDGESFAQGCVVKAAARTGRIVGFDIGANHGEWTEHFPRAMPDARRSIDLLELHAFEPVPATATMFRDRIAELSGHAAVELHEYAKSDTLGQAVIGVYAGGADTNSLHFAQDSRATETTIEIPLTSLDTFFWQSRASNTSISPSATPRGTLRR